MEWCKEFRQSLVKMKFIMVGVSAFSFVSRETAAPFPSISVTSGMS
jgi:hypothetical protein